MNGRSHSAEPPRLGAWILSLFLPAEYVESISGDLQEEFLQLRTKSGEAFARRWYWRQAWKTVARLAGRGFSAAPLSTTGAIVAGLLLLRLVHSLPDRLLSALTDRYLFYWSDHLHAYLWLLRALPIEYLAGSAAVGFLVAVAAKEREMIATTALSTVLFAMAGVASVWVVASTGDSSFLWNLPRQCLDPLVIVIAGAIVRNRRSQTRSSHSA
ncbi:MAG TPA: permease prefix domain 2-containing transporter [Verrucomicrobiae bacterium]|nr:permease prefix domain 2-containing transporter [Verrucomicrobiae bacterium]